MQTRTLGWTGVKLSTIGVGTWAMGGGGWKFSWGPQDDRDSIASIHRALDLGVNWIDAAAVYGLGHGEEVVGKALRGLRQRPFVATKCGRPWDEKGEPFSRLKRESIRAEAEASLKRLGVEVIDLYQIHWPTPDEDIEEAWGAMAELVKEGKVRFAGSCNFGVAHLRRIQPIHSVASLQPPYSLLRREVETELLPYCAQNRIGVIVYSPMQKGLLTGKITRERVQNFAADDHRRNDPLFAEPKLTANLKLVERLNAIAGRRGRSVGQLAVAWTLRRPEVTSAIVGTRSPRQIEEIAAASDWDLTAADIAQIDELLKG